MAGERAKEGGGRLLQGGLDRAAVVHAGVLFEGQPLELLARVGVAVTHHQRQVSGEGGRERERERERETNHLAPPASDIWRVASTSTRVCGPAHSHARVNASACYKCG